MSVNVNNIASSNIKVAIEQVSNTVSNLAATNLMEKDSISKAIASVTETEKNSIIDRFSERLAEAGDTENKNEVAQAASQLNNIVQTLNKKLEFFVDDESGRYGVKVIDKETDKVIRQIPPEEVLALIAKIQEMVGMLIDKTS